MRQPVWCMIKSGPVFCSLVFQKTSSLPPGSSNPFCGVSMDILELHIASSWIDQLTQNQKMPLVLNKKRGIAYHVRT